MQFDEEDEFIDVDRSGLARYCAHEGINNESLSDQLSHLLNDSEKNYIPNTITYHNLYFNHNIVAPIMRVQMKTDPITGGIMMIAESDVIKDPPKDPPERDIYE